MNRRIKGWIALVLMIATSIAATAIKPTELLATARGDMKLEELIPTHFGDWRELQSSGRLVINPQQSELLKKIYSQTLSRTYIRPDGNILMLSIAYGKNQRDGLTLHYPDVCYPAQGFQIKSNSKGTMPTPFGSINVRRLEAELGKRKEPLTYWATIGDKVVLSGVDHKLEQLRYAVKGQIPDGLIFRVSNISGNSPLAYELQQQFVSDLLAALSPNQRQFLSGILPTKDL